MCQSQCTTQNDNEAVNKCFNKRIIRACEYHFFVKLNTCLVQQQPKFLRLFSFTFVINKLSLLMQERQDIE